MPKVLCKGTKILCICTEFCACARADAQDTLGLSQKGAQFGGFEGSFLTNLVVSKVIFYTFSKLFRSCLGSV